METHKQFTGICSVTVRIVCTLMKVIAPKQQTHSLQHGSFLHEAKKNKMCNYRRTRPEQLGAPRISNKTDDFFLCWALSTSREGRAIKTK